jgi:hypothetical protein
MRSGNDQARSVRAISDEVSREDVVVFIDVIANSPTISPRYSAMWNPEQSSPCLYTTNARYILRLLGMTANAEVLLNDPSDPTSMVLSSYSELSGKLM